MAMRFTACGDAIILNRRPAGYAGLADVTSFIRRGDARMVNLETVLSDYDCYASTYCGGIWINARPDVLDDLEAMGFNLFAAANNHSMDYGSDGVLSTRQYLEERRLACAGIGASLYEAAKPAYINTENGRVALISLSSSFVDAARAGDSHDDIPARPGLNPLRFTVEYEVTAEQLRALQEIAAATHMNARIDISRHHGFTPPPPDGCFDFGGVLFRAGDQPRKTSRPNRVDMQRTEKAIQDALQVCDHVVISVHSHEIKGAVDTEPDYFFEEFSHRCIDAGATAVIGTGTHQLKGIEIYHGRPIFYSIGNFIFQLHMIERLPADYFEKYSLPADMSAIQGMNEVQQGGKRGLQADPVYYRAIVPYFEIEKGRLSKLQLLPTELGFGQPAMERGWPRAAEPQPAFDDLCRVSEAYGTEFAIRDNLIEVRL